MVIFCFKPLAMLLVCERSCNFFPFSQFQVAGITSKYAEAISNMPASQVKNFIEFPTPETIGRLGISLQRNEFWDCLDGQALLIIMVSGCLDYHPPIISNTCPPKQSQKSLHLKLVPIPLVFSGVGNCPAIILAE